jgi:hypothetical protein
MHGRAAPTAPEILAGLDLEELVGRCVITRQGAFHRHDTEYGGYVGLCGGERSIKISEVCEDQKFGQAAVYELITHPWPRYEAKPERWLVALTDIVEILGPGEEMRRRLSTLAG